MNTQEKQMILELAERVNGTALESKDPEADKLIQTHIAGKKDAVYIMTQALLIQQQALSGLQERVRQLEVQLQSRPQKKGFFGSLFGGGNPDYSGQSGYRNMPGNTAMPQGNSYNNGWSAGPSPYGRGSSFLGSAMSTAVGVAGGMALFNGLEHLFSGAGSHVASGVDQAVSGAGEEAGSFLGNTDDFQGQESLLDQGFGSSEDMSDMSAGFEPSDVTDNSMDFGGFGDSDFGDW